MRRLSAVLLILILILIILLIRPGFTPDTAEGFKLSEVEAQEMSSEKYKLQGGNLNSGAGLGQSSGFSLTDLIGQRSALIFSSKGSLVQSGLNDQQSDAALSLTVSPTLINYGNFTPNTSLSKQVIITASSSQIPGFVLFVNQNKPLETANGQKLPDSVCDVSHNRVCTKNNAAPWQNNDSYGLGYNLTGPAVDSDFRNENYFRPYASSAKQEDPARIMSAEKKDAAATVNMNIKINVPAQASTGVYSNIINFTLIPAL